MRVNAFVNVILALALTPAAIAPTLGESTGSIADVITRAVRQETQMFPQAEARGPHKINTQSLGVVTDAPSVLIRDVGTGVVLMERGQTIERPMASITKLMTALVLMESYTWDPADAATVLREDVTEGGRWYLRFGDTLTMQDLFSVMLIASGNNETRALVREVGASQTEFVAQMNAKAAQLGMRQTRFADPIGLDPANTSTAQDILILLDAALAQDAIRSQVSQSSVHLTSGSGNTYEIDGTNHLYGTFLNRAPYRVVGGKTGSLDEAGYCLTTRIEREGHVLDVVVLGASQPTARFADVEDLVSWTFDVYRWNDL